MRVKPNKDNQDSLQYFMVSLYLLLVSFFIVLNAMSRLTPEQSALAMQSMAEAFGGKFTETSSLQYQNNVQHGASFIDIKQPKIGNTNSTLSVVLGRYLQFADLTSDHYGNDMFENTLERIF